MESADSADGLRRFCGRRHRSHYTLVIIYEIFKEYNGMAMAAYEYLGDGPINNIVTYLAEYNDKKAEAEANKPSPVASNQPVVVQSKDSTNA